MKKGGTFGVVYKVLVKIMDIYKLPTVGNTYGIANVEETHLYSNEFPYTFDVDIVLIIRDPALPKPLVAICEVWEQTPASYDQMIYFHTVGYLNSITHSSRFLTLNGGKDVLFKYILDGLPNLGVDFKQRKGEKIALKHQTVKEALHTHQLVKKSAFEIVAKDPLKRKNAFDHLIKKEAHPRDFKTSFFKFRKGLAFKPNLPYSVRFDS